MKHRFDGDQRMDQAFAQLDEVLEEVI